MDVICKQEGHYLSINLFFFGHLVAAKQPLNTTLTSTPTVHYSNMAIIRGLQSEKTQSDIRINLS